jgi:hypothetical protein
MCLRTDTPEQRLVALAQAIAITRQRPNHPAFGHPPKGALCDHPLQLGFQRSETVDPPMNFSKPRAGNRIRRLA